MDFIKKHFFILLISSFMVATGCIKFDDPPIEIDPPEVSSTLCSGAISDNEAINFTSEGIELDSYTFSSPIQYNTTVYCNPSVGSYQIHMSEPITESKTYSLTYNYAPGEGEALIQLRPAGNFTPYYYSNSGSLEIEVKDDGTIIISWCEITCQTGTPTPSYLQTTGRVVMD